MTFSTKKGQVRKTARRAYVTKPKKRTTTRKTKSTKKKKSRGKKDAENPVRLLSQK